MARKKAQTYHVSQIESPQTAETLAGLRGIVDAGGPARPVVSGARPPSMSAGPRRPTLAPEGGEILGRAKTMMITILIYSLCTGLSAISRGFWDFAFYRFITGLGVGGEFAVGVALVPLRLLYDRVAGIIASTGGALRLRTSAKALAFDGERVTGVVCDDGLVPAHRVIAAVPPDRLARLCSATLRAADKRLANLEKFTFSPILGVHLAFKRPVLSVPNLSLSGRATHWLFAHEPPEGASFAQRLEAVVSTADAWDGLSEDETARRVLADIAWALGVPADDLARDLAWSRPVLERHATFASTPGVDAIRPRTTAEAGDLKGGVANLYLAGEWTDTGWPSTMEGAARSGLAAAAACTGVGRVAADLPPATLVRLARAIG
jgi:zeta-carotene desaturase